MRWDLPGKKKDDGGLRATFPPIAFIEEKGKAWFFHEHFGQAFLFDWKSILMWKYNPGFAKDFSYLFQICNEDFILVFDSRFPECLSSSKTVFGSSLIPSISIFRKELFYFKKRKILI